MRWIQFSKILPIISFGILFLCLVWATDLNLESGYDTALVSTVVGGAFTFALTTNVWYMKKAQCENTAKIKMETFRVACDERLRYNKAMLLFKSKYGFTEEDIQDVDMSKYMDEAEENMDATVNTAMSDAEELISVQDVNLR